LVLEATNFYAEAGGQVTDYGTLDGAGGALAVENVQSAAGYVVHIGSMKHGTLSVGDRLTCKVDWVRRRKVVPNHTATHMLNFALREVVGENVDQKGSLVDDEKLRFDFSNSKPVSAKALTEAEAIVRRDIERNMEIFSEVVALKDAEKIYGLRAVFGEKYPDPVRVVSVGRSVESLIASPDEKDNREYSVEFCGGTHLKTTGEAGPFAILSEEGISKGVRRVVAVTGDVAASAIASGQNLLERVTQAGSLPDAELQAECAKLKREAAEASIPVSLKAEVNDLLAAYTKKLLEAAKKMGAENKKKAVEEAVAAVNEAAENGGKYCVLRVNVGLDAKALGEAVTQAQKAHAGVPLMLLSTDEAKDKLMVYAGCEKASVKDGFDAGKWAKDTLAACGGKGGGKPTSATGQAPGAGNLDTAMEAANAFAKLNLS
jgi:alanyl-tRNA synthetase